MDGNLVLLHKDHIYPGCFVAKELCPQLLTRSESKQTHNSKQECCSYICSLEAIFKFLITECKFQELFSHIFLTYIMPLKYTLLQKCLLFQHTESYETKLIQHSIKLHEHSYKALYKKLLKYLLIILSGKRTLLYDCFTKIYFTQRTSIIHILLLLKMQ